MELIALVKSISQSDGVNNLIVLDKDNNTYNLKLEKDKSKDVIVGYIYRFVYEVVTQERISYRVKSVVRVEDFDYKLKDETLRDFLPKSPYTLEDSENIIKEYVEKIQNPIVKDITNYVLSLHHDDFFIYPAASKLHHSCVGGLSYHTIGMLKIADGLLMNFPYLKSDYVYAGVILHDVGKTIELSGNINTSYTTKGQLLGHLVIGAMEINEAAAHLGYKDAEETMILEHILISHHGIPQYGSAKRPLTPEALIIWYIDTIDSKFRVLGEELDKVDVGEFTDTIGVIDKCKIYKD